MPNDPALTPSTRRTQQERRDEAESALLDAAAEIITEKGIHGASLAEIGRRAGYSRGLVNHHFGTKAALLERLVERSVRRYRNLMDRATGDNALEVLLHRVELFLDAYLSGSYKHPVIVVMWGTALAQEEDSSSIAEADELAIQILYDDIRRGQADGSMRKNIDLDAEVFMLVGMLRGIAAMSLIKPLKRPLVQRIHKSVRDAVRLQLSPAS